MPTDLELDFSPAKIAAMRSAYKAVAHGKGPINAVVKADQAPTVVDAIAFFSGAIAKVKPVGGGFARIIVAQTFAVSA